MGAVRVAIAALLLHGAPLAVRAEKIWSVSKGSCTLDEDNCISSPGYPEAYKANDRCTIDVEDAFVGVQVVDFKTEVGFDLLVMNDRAYSGDMKPVYKTKPEGGRIMWMSNSVLSRMGWKICPKEVEGPMWVVSGPCPIFADKCITSPDFPRDYPMDHSCLITYPKGFGGLDVIHFDTDPLDIMSFDGEATVSGGIPPVIFRHGSDCRAIEWGADEGASEGKWKICPLTAESAKKAKESVHAAVSTIEEHGVDVSSVKSPFGNGRWDFDAADSGSHGSVLLPFPSPTMNLDDISKGIYLGGSPQ
mmetsp:Transcript_25781/g.51679  ORF Transcript_25781/g.51679 Transcript_25781/m.51679 type:complete len:304 (+) Transcript_25781:76-987(+)|eukprot:CAMPEP_0170255426 /NCGR_PEP_ID=MMETSP0116_2-20130129/27566_1 /TAXON_ID=400756 /ORGANISM="Durinskia baltica, Strain CSIRO CS-38" /LENGTH=303 /DNA_ID=CAMNT_0010506435 /DNA_START=75 /DNA_END=986 /DNA_ORIENTATION=-